MAKSDARFEYKAGMSRTDHDLSQPFTFTSASGMLLPIFYDYASPGDSYYMSHDLPLLRSAVLAAPAMVDVKVHFETFFVPMQMIYEPFENSKFQLRNLRSSYYDMPSQRDNLLPLLPYSSVVTESTNAANMNSWLHADCFRMADLLGLDPLNFCTGNAYGFAPYAPNFFPWQLCAYQTIFQYYYRLDDKSNFVNEFCNLDKQYSSATISIAATSLWMSFFEIHQRPWDFDYYTSMYRSPIVSDANMQKVISTGTQQLANLFPTYQVSDCQVPLTSSGYTAGTNKDINTYSTQASNVAANAFQVNTANIRQLFANEKLAMITGRTKKNYDSQVLAHYGVSVPHDVKHDITMIHHDEYDLKVMEVTSLASTSDAPLGELAGKSYATGNGKSFKFTAPCDGVIMTIFSIEPKRKYQVGFDRINAIADVYDLPTPEFDRLGNIPMYRYEAGTKQTTPQTLTNTDIIGWKERYYAFKRRQSRASYAFFADASGVNNYSPYVLSSRPFAAPVQVTIGGLLQSIYPVPANEDTFYINRGAMDSLCVVDFVNGWLYDSEDPDAENWNVNPHLAYARDPFIVDSYIKCKKVSWMSKDGEPIYNMI